jgi:hypothetical protein
MQCAHCGLAIFAATIQRQIVIFDRKTFWREGRQICWARMYVKDFLALIALKMMVMTVT